jgi:predicted polyphosphate/ATP-dependent NAD kinase
VAQRIGFVVNPIAGIGGRVGLKGSDGVVELALSRGATPRAGLRALEMLRALRDRLTRHPSPPAILWLTCAGEMGEDVLREAGFEAIEVVDRPGGSPAAADTRRAVRAFLEAGAALVVFCGGDGTARDVCSVTGRETPILGIPAGVKMYSSVFGIGPARTAEILLGHLEERFGLADAEVLDVDEAAFREGRLEVELYGSARIPHEPELVQSAKQSIEHRDEEDSKARIAEHLAQELEARPETLFLLGPGTTVASVARRNGLPKTLLGVDAIRGGRTLAHDLGERELIELLETYREACLVVSPIGAQGFVFGRGNPQLSPRVLRRLGSENIIVVATPAKLDRTPFLRFDTGDAELDARLASNGFLPVVTGYHRRRMVETRI